MSTKFDYEQMMRDYYYANSPYTKYGAPATPTNTNTTTNAINNGLQNSNTDTTSIFATSDENKNVCTDDSDDGKIGFLSAAGNFIEGGVKGIANGLKSCVTDKDGNFSLLKTLGTVAIGAACIVFPAVGAVACGIGAVAGGANIVKGAVAASKATTDAEKKAAIESIGDGTFTAVGSVLGMKGSIGAVKGASTAAIDDVVRTLGKVDDATLALSNVDDAMRATGNIDDVVKATGNIDDAVKALKNVDLKNTDEVIKALNNAGIKNADEVAKSISNLKDTSALGQLDDTANMTTKAKALGKDMLSSTKNGWKKTCSKAKTGKEVFDYETTKHKQTKAQKDLDDATKVLDEMRKNNASADDILAQKDKIYNLEEKLNGLTNELNARAGYMSDNATKVASQIDNATDAAKNYASNYKNRLSDKTDDIIKAKEALAKAKKGNNQDEIKAAQEALAQARKTRTEAFKQPVTDVENFATNKSSTLDALKKTHDALNAKSPEGKMQLFKNIKNMDKTGTAKQLYNSARKDIQAVIDFIQQTDGTYAQAVQEFGYPRVQEALITFGGAMLADSTV